MKLLTRDSDYAVRAVLFLAGSKKNLVAAIEIKNALNMPWHFLRAILQKLAKAGLITSVKGVGGGFSLRKDPQTITLLDIMQVFQGSVDISECTFKKHICPNLKKCPLRDKLKKIENFAIKQLSEVNVASLVNKG